jgi:hypothetical protein
MDTTPRWSLASSLDRAAVLARRPGVLLLVMLALNAVALGYAGFTHDARLYGVQVLNQVEPGSFADDLFFRFGSQDRYSVFSRAVAPAARVLGLPLTFFLLYLVGKTFFLWAVLRLLAAILPDPRLVVLSALFAAASTMPFGGYAIFCVNESFLTPRLFACALTLLALERMLGGRAGQALGLLFLAALLHPIMALAGFPVLALWWVSARLPARLSLTLAAATGLGLLGVLLYRPLGYALFGRMDDAWLDEVRIGTVYNFPLLWEPGDWLGLALSLTAVCAGAVALRREQPRLARLLAIVAYVGAGGMLATTLASLAGYRLLFQAQPYRAVWLLAVLQMPVVLLLLARAWRSEREASRLAAVGLLTPLLLQSWSREELLLPALLLPVCALVTRGLDREPRSRCWLSAALLPSVVLGLLMWGVFRCGLVVHFRERLGQHMNATAVWNLALGCLGPTAWALVALFAVTALSRQGHMRRPAVVVAVVFVLASVGWFAAETLPAAKARFRRDNQDLEFVGAFLAAHSDGAKPTVYWCTGEVDRIWLDLRAHSFYDRLQIQGVMFSRRTALEGRRRACVVRQFEVERLCREQETISPHWRRLLEKLYRLDFASARPTRDDLEALCREEGVDFAVLPHDFDGLYTASNGRVFIYDCKQVHAKLGTRNSERGTEKFRAPRPEFRAEIGSTTSPSIP